MTWKMVVYAGYQLYMALSRYHVNVDNSTNNLTSCILQKVGGGDIPRVLRTCQGQNNWDKVILASSQKGQ